jgi:pimeloyl-ACP methyl ester carboxylesterase
MIFYYESANGPHLEFMCSRGSVPMLLLKGFFWTLYSHLLLVLLTLTALHRRFWHLPSGQARRTPIIFVHGLYHNHTAWFLYLRWFRKWGWQHVKALNLTGKFRSIKDFAHILAGEVDQVLAETGAKKTDLVGHSMGGLVIRTYLAENSAKAKVRRVVTLGSPHAGSKLAVFAVGAAAREILPGSPFLESLSRTGSQVPEGGGFYAIYSIVDNMVLPNDSARLPGDEVNNVEAPVVNHVGLLFSRRTAGLVRQALEKV